MPKKHSGVGVSCLRLKQLFIRQRSSISSDDKLRTIQILTQYSQTLAAAKMIHILFKFAMIAGYSAATENVNFLPESALKRTTVGDSQPTNRAT